MIEVEQKQGFEGLSISAKAKLADSLGVQTGKLINNAVKKANKILAAYGFSVSVELKFHELPKEE